MPDTPLREIKRLSDATNINRVVPAANPMFMAVEHDSVIIRTRDESLFVKTLHDDKQVLIDFNRTTRAAIRAAKFGVGPEVLEVHPDINTMILKCTPQNSRVAKMSDLADLVIFAAVYAKLDAQHRSGPIGSSSSVFSEIEYLITECKRERIFLPTDIDTLVGLTRESRDAIDNLEIKRTLCHRDVIASNVLLEPEATHLCDYDR